MMKVVLLEMACFGINLGLSWMSFFVFLMNDEVGLE
jgi:hypothetical protein